MRWVDEKQKGHSFTKVSCPQCNTDYVIVFPPFGKLCFYTCWLMCKFVANVAISEVLIFTQYLTREAVSSHQELAFPHWNSANPLRRKTFSLIRKRRSFLWSASSIWKRNGWLKLGDFLKTFPNHEKFCFSALKRCLSLSCYDCRIQSVLAVCTNEFVMALNSQLTTTSFSKVAPTNFCFFTFSCIEYKYLPVIQLLWAFSFQFGL